MPWDQSRPVPWKRILTFEVIYVGLFVLFILLFSRDNLASASVSIVFALIATTALLYVVVKFGYDPIWLKSRAEQAEIRAEKIAARQALRSERRGEPAPRVEERYRPAPTKRTSTGPTNRPRRTRDTRKR